MTSRNGENMKHINKKITAFIMSFIMVSAMLPQVMFTTAAADDGGNLTIATEDDWNAFASRVNNGESFSGVTVTLENDLEFANTSFAAVGNDTNSFNGTFDGADYSITLPENSASTLFGYIGAEGCVKNLSVDGSITVSTKYVGGIAAVNYGTILNCINIADVTTTYQSGYAGGIVGVNYGTVSQCTNGGDVVASYESTEAAAGAKTCYAGGIAAYNYQTIEKSSNRGDVLASTKYTNANTYAGGIAGYACVGSELKAAMTISNCYNTGDVTSVKAETMGSFNAYAGGIAGCVPYSNAEEETPYTLNNCYSAGELTASIYDSTSTYGAETWGIAYNSTNSSVSDYLIYKELYWLESTAEYGLRMAYSCTAENISSKTENEMKTEAFVSTLNQYAGENENIWMLKDSQNYGYPMFTWQLVPPEAQIGDTTYDTIAEAVEAADKTATAENPVVITLLDDVSLDESLDISKANVQLELNNHTITCEDNASIITGMGATSSLGADPACQASVTNDGSAVFKAAAVGGQLRYDQKASNGQVIGTYAGGHCNQLFSSL